MADSFVFYKSFMDALEYVPEEDFCDCVKSLLRYAFYGDSEPESQAAKMFMALVMPQIDANARRRENGKKGGDFGKLGGRPKKEKNPTGVSENTPNVNGNDNEDTKENSPSESKRKVFVPPTVDEVEEYCNKRRNGIDPEAFVAFYESKGWKVGNQRMKDWKAAVITWEKKKKKDEKPPDSVKVTPMPNRFDHNVMQRTGSVKEENDAMVRQILGMR